MTSGNLYFRLMREDLKRRAWATALIGLGCFFLYPVVAAFIAGDIKEAVSYEAGIEKYAAELIRWLSFENGMTVFAMIVFSLICGMSSFSYLNSRSKVDFYHSLPIRREMLYAVNYIDGILILALPYALNVILAAAVGTANGAGTAQLWQTALSACGLHLTYFILMYATVTLAAMMTGNLVVGALGSAVLAFYIPLATALVNGFFTIFFHTYDPYMERWLVTVGTRMSPVLEYVYQLERYQDGMVALSVAGALTVSALLAGLGCLFYRRRPSESAGRAMAFEPSCPVIRVLITLLSATGLGAFFWSLRESTGWMVFGILCGAVISHCVIEIIYHFDFKRLFCHRGQLIGCILVSAAVMLVFRYDVFGYDRYLPGAERVSSASVRVERLSSWVSYGDVKAQPDGSYIWENLDSSDYVEQHMKCEDVETVRGIAAEGIRAVQSRNNKEDALSGGNVEDSETWSQIYICYTLKSGRKVHRRYCVSLDAVMPQVEKLYADDQYQRGNFPVMNLTADTVEAVHFRDLGQPEGEERESVLNRLTAEQKNRILETYRKEFSAMTPERMKEELPVGLIRFAGETEEKALAWWEQTYPDFAGIANGYRLYESDLTNRNYYPVYPSFAETTALLRQYGVTLNTGYRGREIVRIMIRKDKYGADGDWLGKKEIVITDPGEIDELRASLIPAAGQYYNRMFRVEDFDIEVNTAGGGDGEVDAEQAYLAEGRLPEFVKERLDAAEYSE